MKFWDMLHHRVQRGMFQATEGLLNVCATVFADPELAAEWPRPEPGAWVRLLACFARTGEVPDGLVAAADALGGAALTPEQAVELYDAVTKLGADGAGAEARVRALLPRAPAAVVARFAFVLARTAIREGGPVDLQGVSLPDAELERLDSEALVQRCRCSPQEQRTWA